MAWTWLAGLHLPVSQFLVRSLILYCPPGSVSLLFLCMQSGELSLRHDLLPFLTVLEYLQKSPQYHPRCVSVFFPRFSLCICFPEQSPNHCFFPLLITCIKAWSSTQIWAPFWTTRQAILLTLVHVVWPMVTVVWPTSQLLCSLLSTWIQ